jgi:hypothetical protein
VSKKNILRIIFIAILVCFLLPYVSVSCSNQTLCTINGYNLITGGTLKVDTSSLDKISGYFGTKAAPESTGKNYGPQLLVILAFAAAAAGLVVTFIKSKKEVLYPAVTAILGFVFTIASTFTIHSWITDNSRQADMLIKINYKIGFFLILIGFAAATVLGLYATFYKKPMPEQQFAYQQTPYQAYADPQPQNVPPESQNQNRFCSQCGSPVGVGDAFCSNCGTKVE